VYENPIANAGVDNSICKSSSIQLSGKGGIVYSWTPAVGLDNAGISNPRATPTVTTQYTLKVVDEHGCKDSDVVVVTVVENPLPSFTGKNVVCKNEHGVEFQATASGNNYFWSIQNGEINGGQGMSKVVTHWSDAAPSGKIALVESLKQSPYCSTALEKTITIGGTVAPTPEQLVLKANKIESNILICPNCLFDTLQWGYEEKQNRAEKNTCSDLVWCRYSQIDTFNNFYWVKIGNDPACLTKSYFNAPKLLGIHEDVSHGIAEIYPNPTNGLAKVRTTGIMKKIVVYNAIGLEILHITPSSFNYEYDLDLTSYARGIYFVKVFEDEGVSVLQLVLND
jgi:hypothetical protein